MRISCVAYARLLGPNSTYAVLVNKGRLTRTGERMLTPIGGALKYEPGALAFLKGIGADNWENGNDLRFTVPDSRVSDVIAWFGKRRGRETSVLREFREELIDETGILTPTDLDGAKARFVRFARHDSESTRSDVPQKQTVRLIEVHSVVVSDSAMSKFVAAARQPLLRRQLNFVTKKEIMSKLTRDAIDVNPVTQSILPPV